jgi:hypothetical protein
VFEFSKDNVKNVEEAPTKCENTDEALEEIIRLNLNSHVEKAKKGHA